MRRATRGHGGGGGAFAGLSLAVLSLVAVVPALACNELTGPDDTASPALAVCENGFALSHPCSGIDLVAWLPSHEFAPDAWLSDVWGWTDDATGTEWVLATFSSGTGFVDISDPANPVLAGILPMTDGAWPSDWRDVKVYRDHAFIVSDLAGSHGMQVFDLAHLRDSSDPPATFGETARYDRVASAHNIAINQETGFAYIVGANGGGETCGGGLHMVDISQPRNPRFVGCFADHSTGFDGTGYTHDVLCIVYRGPDMDHGGREVCLGANETGLSIADVSDKAAPFAISATSYPSVGYAHQLWVDEQQEYLYLNDELDESHYGDPTRTLVWDIRDLDDPVVVREFLNTTDATDHNLYVRGDSMYQANYQAGLRVIDISDRENPREVAFFDTEIEPDDGGYTYDGAWSSFPYFASEVIPVTSTLTGLYILRLSR